MNVRQQRRGNAPMAILLGLLATWVLVSCGGGTGSGNADHKTYLNVQTSDADGDVLHYQWRVTAGSIENRDSNQTVWTLPDGPGLHFAYVTVSDGKGGYAEQQYAVATDALETSAPAHAAVSHVAPVPLGSGSTGRLRVTAAGANLFEPVGGGTALQRTIYLPDVRVTLKSGATSVFSGVTDLGGELSVPALPSGAYDVECTTSASSPRVPCGSYVPATITTSPTLPASQNLRLHGHVGLADGAVCGTESEFFGTESAATVRLLQAGGVALTPVVRVNRFGDYAIDAAVPVHAALQLQVQCEGYSRTLDVPVSPDPAGYVSSALIELSHRIPNSRPVVAKMVANGPDGNVRGEMVVPEPGDQSNLLPGALQFLTYKGDDTRLSACKYYESLGAVGSCEADGTMNDPISFDDWKRQKSFAPYNAGNVEVSALYINEMDLNLVRHMVATPGPGPQESAFYVCNGPGPEGQSQDEIDDVLETALEGDKQVACVAMEWSATPGVNGGQPFTKFLTFGPDGSLIPSVNLDGRGEKYMPGACVACHGGSQYTGHFPEQGQPSPYLGSRFLPFDTGNYLFGSRAALTELAQGAALKQLNMMVRATEEPILPATTTPTMSLIDGWYAGGRTALDKTYLPPAWRVATGTATAPEVAKFYHQVVGSSCRTCHVSLGPNFDWDALSPATFKSRVELHACGGTADLVKNASMPNALVSRDRVAERATADPDLARLMQLFLGCDVPLPDPIYPKR